MALIDAEGRYYKITDYNNGGVNIVVYQNAEHRQNGNSEFQTTKNIGATVGIVENESAIEGISIKNNIYTKAYEKLKTIEPYNTMEDA